MTIFIHSFKTTQKIRDTTTYCDLLFYLTSECVCANSLVLQIQKKKRIKTKQIKTKEFRWRGGRDLPTDYMEKHKIFKRVFCTSIATCKTLLLEPTCMAGELRTPYRQAQDLQTFPDETVQRNRKQIPECVHLSSLKGTLRCGGKQPYTEKVFRKPPKIRFPKTEHALGYRHIAFLEPVNSC